MSFVRSPIVYAGSKGRYAEVIQDNLPKEGVDKALDAFTGSGDVGVLMMPYKNVVCNDFTPQLVEMHQMFQRYSPFPNKFIKYVTSLLERYDLQEDIGKKGSDRQKAQKVSYHQLRDDYNLMPSPEVLYALHCTSNSNMIRFSQKSGMNVPYGSRRFNGELQAKLKNWFGVLQDKGDSLTFINENFRKIDFNEFDFVYCDPPYLNTTAAYQQSKKTGWGLREEYALYTKLENLDKAGKKFMLSNQVCSKGVENHILLEWLSQNPHFKVIYLDSSSYKNCSYQRTNKATEEVLILNY